MTDRPLCNNSAGCSSQSSGQEAGNKSQGGAKNELERIVGGKCLCGCKCSNPWDESTESGFCRACNVGCCGEF